MCIRDSVDAAQGRRFAAVAQVGGGITEGAAELLAAVSYTHLDVYKRQAL